LLMLKQNGTEISRVAAGGWIALPNGDLVSPAQAGWANGEYSLEEVPAPVPPTAEELLAQSRQAMRLSFAQLMIGLVSEGWITTAEGEAWLTGTLPAPVVALIATLPTAQQFPAKARALRPTVIERNEPLVTMLGAAQGKTDAQLDTFFQTYAVI